MPMQLRLANNIALTGTAIGPAIDCKATPFMGGAGRNGLLSLETAPGGAASVAIQGHPGDPLAPGVAPASGDAGWYTILTLTSASRLENEFAVPRWLRYNITVLGTGTLNAVVTGVQ